MALPTGGLIRVEVRWDTEAYQLTKSFLDAPEQYLHHLFADDSDT